MLAAAARHGIPVPGLERLVAQIGELESGAAMDEDRIAALARCAAMTAVPPPSAVDGVDVAALHRWLDARRPQLVDDLVAYAELETPSDDLALLKKGLAHVEEWLAERLGPPADRAHHASGEYGDVVVLEYAGHGDRPLTLLAHYDTVWSAGTLDGWPVRVDGDRVSGPGVFDMKAGLVQAAWAVRALRAADVPHPPLRLLLNGDEEVGSRFSRPLIEQACADAAAVLVFEASADGALKTGRKGVGIFEVAARGVEAHAGLDPESGASAVDEIARVVLQLHAASDLRGGHHRQRRCGAGRHPLERRRGHGARRRRRPGAFGRGAGAHRRAAAAGLPPMIRGPRWRCAAAGTVRSWSRTPPSRRSSRWRVAPPSSWGSSCGRRRSAEPATATSPPPWACRSSTGSARSAAVPTPGTNT